MNRDRDVRLTDTTLSFCREEKEVIIERYHTGESLEMRPPLSADVCVLIVYTS